MLGSRADALLLGQVLSATWRPDCPPLALMPDTLHRVEPLLIGSGAAALAWRRIRGTPLEARFPGIGEAARRTVLDGFMRDDALRCALSALRRGGVNPVVLKGAAAARHYAEPDTRPRGDIDLLAAPEQAAAAERLLSRAGIDDETVDLHVAVAERVWPLDTLLARAIRARLSDVECRVLCPEDELAHLCLHFLKHGGWRPTWLCDVAAAIEDRPPAFDWPRCLGPERRRARWIASTLGLAVDLLAAEAPRRELEAAWRESLGAIPRHGVTAVPAWLRKTVIAHWRAPYAIAQPPLVYRIPMREEFRRPLSVPAAALRRWPDPLRASFAVGAPFDRLPRGPFQLQYALHRAVAAVRGKRQ